MNTEQQAAETALEQQQRIKNYYQFQSRIYDTTRWAFLFGRLGILQHIPFTAQEVFRLAEIGCGTGFNLDHIARAYPQASLIGVDVSADMLDQAREKLLHFPNTKIFYHQAYDLESQILRATPPDIILFSYALTMINPQWKDLLAKAHQDLPKGGKIMVVDFHNSRLRFFKNHMGNHHVRMDAHVLPELKRLFTTRTARVKKAYMGIWEYFIYVGEKA
ncbi:MAG: class I SAM-dependent methyltransferase [Bacteroidota bacterium]